MSAGTTIGTLDREGSARAGNRLLHFILELSSRPTAPLLRKFLQNNLSFRGMTQVIENVRGDDDRDARSRRKCKSRKSALALHPRIIVPAHCPAFAEVFAKQLVIPGNDTGYRKCPRGRR